MREHSASAPLLHRQVLDRPAPAQHPLEQCTVTVVAHVVEEDGDDLDDVPVAVDHRMVELLPQTRRPRVRSCSFGHGDSYQSSGSASTLRMNDVDDHVTSCAAVASSSSGN